MSIKTNVHRDHSMPIGYNVIRGKILSEEYELGRLLPERALSRELGISPILLREAFQRLADEGLVQKVPSRGWRVCKVTEESNKHLLQIFVCLQDLAVREAVEQLTQETADQLRKIALCEDLENMVLSLCIMTNNVPLMQMIEDVMKTMQRAEHGLPNWQLAYQSIQRDILFAVADGDMNGAHALVHKLEELHLVEA